MVLQQPQSRVCSGSQSLDASPRVALLVAEIAQLKEAPRQRQQIGVATGLLAQRFAISPEGAWTLAADNADDENSGVASSELSIVKDKP
jgi:AmiR/NasT family two-component response regulator